MRKGAALRDGLVIKEGVACAQAVVFKNVPLHVEQTEISINDVPHEIKLFKDARENTRRSFEEEKSHTKSQDARDFLDTSIMYLVDPFVEKQIIELISVEHINAESAIHRCFNRFVEDLIKHHDPFIMHNEFEIRNLAEHIILELHKRKVVLPKIQKDCILIANNITPAQFLTLNCDFIKGVLLEDGNTNSHMAIVLRSMNIPAIFNVENATSIITDGMNVLLDASNNKIYLEPLEELVWIVKKHEEERIAKDDKISVTPLIAQYKTTKAGDKIQILANIGSISEIQDLRQRPSSGIGLFRTEFLFMNHTQDPSEEEQFQTYKKILESLPKRFSVTFRTFDFSQDKLPMYLTKPINYNFTTGTDEEHIELNDVLYPQLKALLRASTYVQEVKVMFPMIAECEDLIYVLDLYKKARNELSSKGISIGNIKIGIMIETPAAAIMSQELAKMVDFFSIGTNDLTRYTESCSREFATRHSDELSPAVLKLIAITTESASKAGIPVSICGELVHEQRYLPLFCALGLRNFSVAPFFLNNMLYAIHNIDIKIPNDFKNILANIRTRKEIIELSQSISKENLGPIENSKQ